MRTVMQRSVAVSFGLALLAALVPGTHAATVRITTPAASEFQPSTGQKTAIGYSIDDAGSVTIEIHSPDGDLVRTLASKSSVKAGAHRVEWDGRDDEGQVVPDEVYHPVLRCSCGGDAPSVFDTREMTGGVVIEKIRPDLSADGTISFDLPQAARALVRVGIKGGAMMRAVDTWSPRSAGRVRVSWDGFDQSRTVHLLGQPGLTVLVTAFTLPEHSIISSGNGKTSYFAYRKARGWAVPFVNESPGKLERDGQRLSRQAKLPRSLLEDPRVSIRIVEALGQDATGAFKVTGPVTFRVDMPPEDKWLVQQGLYEVGFFLDYQFVSEEETGYTPITWRWDPAGVPPGEHTMTVNISGLWGQVGVASVRLMVDEKRSGESLDRKVSQGSTGTD